MSSDRRTHSEVIYNNLFAKEQQNNDYNRYRDLNFNNISKYKGGFIIEDTNDNIFTDSMVFPDQKNLKTEINFNFDDNISIDNKMKLNKNVIKVISTKFHELFLKMVKENKSLKIEINSGKNDDDLANKRDEISIATNEKTERNINNNQYNIGNLSLADLNNDLLVKEKISESFDENNLLNSLKEEEIDMFNNILNEFLLQVNELESKDDMFRREILRKQEDVTKFNFEIEELSKNKHNLITEIQNITLKLNEYKAFLFSLPSDFIRKCDSVIIHSDIESEDKMYSYSLRNKDDRIVFNQSDNNLYDDVNRLVNNENKDYIIKKLVEENNQFKEIVSKLKNDQFTIENEILEIEKEFENMNSLCRYGIEFVKSIEENYEAVKFNVDKIYSKYNKIVFKIEVEDT